LSGNCQVIGKPLAYQTQLVVQRKEVEMNTRRSLVIAAAVSALAKWTSVCAQAPAQATEASLREAIRKYVDAWNRHDVKAWSSMLTEDIWYTETLDFYERMKGKKAVLLFFADNVKTTDITWEVIRLRVMPDGTTSVVLRHVSLVPPKVNGKYKLTFESVPSVSRWRYERGGWKMFFFTTHKGTALDAMKKDGVE
jgi:ketosteroid isomerase-like protein